MHHPLRPLIVAVAVLFGAGCSGDDDEVGQPTDLGATTTTAAAASVEEGEEGEPAPPDVVTTATSRPASTVDDAATTSPTAPAAPDRSSPAADPLPETGVPGLDSDDDFCSAWSRFGGTWQVLLVGSTFLDAPDRVASWEVASAAVVLDAYDIMLADLPDELEPERDAVADGYFGALQRRAAEAADALAAAGAEPADVAALADAWLDALAERDPTTPDLAVVEPAGLADVVASAAAELRSRRVEFHLDPSLIVTVETPATDAYLESTCPDRGTLAGTEVDP